MPDARDPPRQPRRYDGVILQRTFSTFPPGFPGWGLLLLRLAIGATVLRPLATAGAGPMTVLAALIGTALAVGLLTPVAGVTMSALALAATFGAVRHPAATPAASLLVAAVALALAMLGPGAYSLDARLFGRREVVLSHRPRR